MNDNPSGMTFEVGSQCCSLCNTKDNIIQFERATKRKGLPIVEIVFLCKSCAEKHDLIKDSVEVLK